MILAQEIITRLSSSLREGTKAAHVGVERSPRVQDFMRGRITRAGYANFVVSLYTLYAALERALEAHRAHPCVAPIYFPELMREQSLAQDLAFYYGAQWRAHLRRSPAAARYIDHLERVAAGAPELLVAHCYARYLGDLSGGQILKKILERTLGLEGGAGAAFYTFSQISDADAFKQNFRERLDAIPVDAGGAARIVAEANLAFDLNQGLFDDLAA